MNQAYTARVYFLFALLLLGLAWTVTHKAKAELTRIQAVQTAALEKASEAN
jgi:hypothetical protein